jgi:hypothetical protein
MSARLSGAWARRSEPEPTLQQKNRKMGKNGQEQGRQKMQLSDNEMSIF